MTKNIEQFTRDRLLVFLQKNKDYGDSFADSMKLFPVAGRVRILDKINRIKQLIKADRIEVQESLDDTILDLFNYAAMHYCIEAEIYYVVDIAHIIYSWAGDLELFFLYLDELMYIDECFVGLTDEEQEIVRQEIIKHL